MPISAGMFVVTSRYAVQVPSSSMPSRYATPLVISKQVTHKTMSSRVPGSCGIMAGELLEFDIRVELAPYLVGPVACFGGQPQRSRRGVDGGCSLDGRVEVVAA